MTQTKWNPTQYEKFKDQRAKPFYDLKNLIQPMPLKSALDLGCGTGELTQKLFESLKPQRLLGIDSSSEMLEKSKKFEGHGLNFKKADIASFKPGEKFDLIFSNAALQWLPDHERLFPQIFSWVSDGGQIAIQMPFNFDHPSHTIAARVAKSLHPDIFTNLSERSTLALERYAELLFENGFTSQVARIEIYGHPMESGLDVIEWTKGTLLTRYQALLSETQFTKFLEIYQQELVAEIGSGPYFYAFKRALLWGKKEI